MHYKETTLMEIGKIAVNATEWPNTENTLAFEWIEDAEPPHSDTECSEDIDKEKAIELINALTKHFELDCDNCKDAYDKGHKDGFGSAIQAKSNE